MSGSTVPGKVAIIIPAYNEADRISSVIRAALASKLAHEVIVVNDGSADATSQVAARFQGIRVLDLPSNRGKGGAMVEGVKATDAEIIAFVDADLEGLTGPHIDSIIAPIRDRVCDMCLGVFRGGKFWSNTGQIIFPYISGQRAMRKELFLRIPNLADLRFGVELGMHSYCKRMRRKVKRVVLRGVSNSYKEMKYGLVKGFEARRRMWREMALAARMDRQRRLKRRKRSRLMNLERSEINLAIKKLRRKNQEDR